jgi:hypothetical protein
MMQIFNLRERENMSLRPVVLNLDEQPLLFRVLFSAKELGIKDTLPAYLDPAVLPQDLITGVTFASSGSGFDPLTPKLVVHTFSHYFTLFFSNVNFSLFESSQF